MARAIRVEPIESPRLIAELVGEFAEVSGRSEAQSLEILLDHIFKSVAVTIRKTGSFDGHNLAQFLTGRSEKFKLAYLAYARQEALDRETAAADMRSAQASGPAAGAPKGGKSRKK